MLRILSKASGLRVWIATFALTSGVITPGFAQAAKKKSQTSTPPPAGAVARIQKSGTLKLGYRADARPFSFKDEAGKPAGYSVDLCQSLAGTIKTDLNLPDLQVQWVPVALDEQVGAVQQHQVDILCGATSVTLERRKSVDFSTPIFPGGVGVVTRSDAPTQLRNILAGKAQNYTPTWRAVALNVIREQVFVTLPGTTAEQWIQRRGRQLQVEADVRPVPSYEAGLQSVVSRKANAFFAERAVLLDAVEHNKAYHDLTMIDRQFTYEPLALAIERGDDDFRLLVDRDLSRFYTSPEFTALYTRYFGEPKDETLTFFRWNALPN